MPVTQVHATRARSSRTTSTSIPPNRASRSSDGTLDVVRRDAASKSGARRSTSSSGRSPTRTARAPVAVVLSGTGPNGSSGLKRVKEYGGLVVAQDPGEAEYGDMPRNAIATRLVDLVLPVAEMPGSDRRLPRAAAPATTTRAERRRCSAPTATRCARFSRCCASRTGHDFSNYKPATVLRRDRAADEPARASPTLAGYARLIREQPDEAVALMKDLLISVTNFFRDRAGVRRRSSSGSSRGCSRTRDRAIRCVSGSPAARPARRPTRSRCCSPSTPATALEQPAHPGVRHRSRRARDRRSRARASTPKRTSPTCRTSGCGGSFSARPGGYRVRRELRELVLFAHHNVIKDPPFSHLDLISCRNLLIYLNRAVQERVIETFHFALRPGGFLFLGTSEIAEGASDLFVRVRQGRAHLSRAARSTGRIALPADAVAAPVAAARRRAAAEPRAAERIAAGRPASAAARAVCAAVARRHRGSRRRARVGAGRRASCRSRGGEPSRDLLQAGAARAARRSAHRAAPGGAASARSVEARGVAVALDDGGTARRHLSSGRCCATATRRAASSSCCSTSTTATPRRREPPAR